MKYYLAPMEGITGYIFRNAYHKVFEDFDEYITPFLSPATDCVITPKELREVHPDNNQGMNVVPQILANRADFFIETTKYLEQLGYKEINLNLGCPSGTVTAKKKGAGALRDLDLVRKLLEGISNGSPLPFSVKTRVGFEYAYEFTEILNIYKDYPMTKLIIHPRTKVDFYTGPLHDECVHEAFLKMKTPIVFNGDVFDLATCQQRIEQFPCLEGIMLGRGMARNPFLLEECRRGQLADEEDFKNRLPVFLDELLKGYAEIMKDEPTTLFRLKELWSHMENTFDDSDKALKGIRKSKGIAEYKAFVKEVIKQGTRVK